jgi:methylated-DNA-[protein]-cysteine S-methyltransferase
MTHFALFPTAIGACGLAWRGALVVAVSLPEASPAATAARLTARTGAVEAPPPPDMHRAIEAIAALLAGGRTDLTFIACDFSRSEPFAVQVYTAARAIPPGETRTYGAIAAHLGDRQLARAVGQALARNPFPIIVPCHRVIGANEKLTGFSAPGGVSTKRKLLTIEGAWMGGAPGLFDDLD